MPVSGHEETGVKSFAGQFSSFIAGVPIKKRRFPLIQPSSPVSEEETELQRKDNSSTAQGSNVKIAGAPIKKRRFPSLQASSSPSEEASPPEETDALRKESQGSTLSAGSAGLSDTNDNPVFEERKASFDDAKANTEQKANSDDNKANVVGKNSCIVVPKVEEPVLETQPRTLDIVNSIEKVKVIQNEGNNKEMESQMIKGNPELLLAAKEGLLALSIGADVSKQNAQDISKQESQAVPESSSLSLSLKEHLFPAIASPEVEDSHPKIENVEPVSLELSLSKEECSPHSVNTDAKNSGDTTQSHSNRANWDLNTTMDAWEEYGSDAGSVKTPTDGLKIIGSALSEKLLTCSTDRKPLTGAQSVKKTLEESQSKASMISSGLFLRKSLAGVDSINKTLEETQNKASMISSGLYGRPHESIDPLNKCLSSYLQRNAEEPSRFSVKLNPGNVIPSVSLSNVVATAGDASTSSFRSVKPEPCDENLRKDLKEAYSLDSVAVKQEFLMHSNVMSSKSSDASNIKSVDPMFIKSEPGREGSQERSKTAESSTDQLGKELPQGSDNCSSTRPMPVLLKAPQISADGTHSPAKPVCTAELTTIENIASQLENSTRAVEVDVEKTCQGASSSSEQVHLETVVIPMLDSGTVLSDPNSKMSSILTKEDAADHEDCRLKLMNDPPPDPRDSGENDEEKITLSEDDSYGSDFESDDNHATTVGADTEQHVEDDDYEDGEVREPLDPSTVEETICEVREVEHPDDYENQQVEKGVVSVIVDHPTSSHVVENDNKTGIHSEINEDGVDIQMVEKPGKVVDKNVCVQESFDDENSAPDRRSIDDVLQRELSDVSERIFFSGTEETEPPFDQPSSGSHGVDVVQCAEEVIKTTDTVSENDFNFPKMEGSANTDDSAKDFNNGGNQGRIIDLSRAANSSSPSKTRPIPGRSFSSRAERDVLPDTLDGEQLHRGRDEVYVDSSHKFSRERHQDMSGGRNSRMNFVRGRGRMNSRMDSHRNEWDSDREYSGEFYNGPTQYRGPRPKYVSAMADSDMEYNNAPGGSYVGNGRLGRKPLNDGSYIAPRRRSPGGRDGIQMGHRNPRTISPNRCMGGDGSELVGVRHNEKFIRGYPDNAMDPVFSRPQQFEGMEGRFARGGGRNFSSMQRRGPPQIRSKSPIRSRSRSPVPWSSPRRRSPRRRSPEGFGNHPDCSHRRPMYRVDRMRSPPVFSGERVVRRHGSPSFMSRPSNEMRDIDSARDNGHPRPGISNRSPSGRMLIRNRRFDVDPRDRGDNDDDYFGGPMHSGGRILELNGEANGEERRRFGERRGPVRTFRPPYNNNVGENFHINAEDGPRQHYRFCSDDTDFHERGNNNMRERDFDRRVKGGRGPANVPPRRTRNMDEQEENFRHGGQVWNDDSFDDISRVKRKRF